jgi:hypothetical protein
MSPTVGQLLKERRQGGKEGGVVAVVPREGVPEVRVDRRKWPGVRVEEGTLAEVLGRGPGTVAVLVTPLALQGCEERGSLVAGAWEVLEEWGYWWLTDIMPASMPGHWVFRCFPGAWKVARGVYWDGQEVYRQLRQVGFAVEMEEWTFREAVRAEVALEVARGRPGILGLLGEEEYGVGLRRLEELVRGGAVIGSEVTLVAVVARRGGQGVQRFRIRKLVLDKVRGTGYTGR